MATQDRAIRTRQAIIAAAATVFEECGYQTATITKILQVAGVTKGALYFHFKSKEDLAQAVLSEGQAALKLPTRTIKTQELVDLVMVHAYRLQTDPLVRASVHLNLDPYAHSVDRSLPFREFGEICRRIFTSAKSQGELLPHAEVAEVADVLVGSFAGIQAMSEALNGYKDLGERAGALLRYVLPSIVVPSGLASLDYAPDRGARVHAEATALQSQS
ncbi:MAG: TetR/AcrR family transcriptional regulator [Streptomyces sp.]|jgi:AcrR family transcriptional regulator|nr:TetR/AcrR family transcriptional regulator [Streptomyces sp.]